MLYQAYKVNESNNWAWIQYGEQAPLPGNILNDILIEEPELAAMAYSGLLRLI
jgi:hypothetical protein